MWDVTNKHSCRHDVLIVSHGIMGLDGTDPHLGWGSALIPFVMTRAKHVDIVCFSPTILWDIVPALGVFVTSHIG